MALSPVPTAPVDPSPAPADDLPGVWDAFAPFSPVHGAVIAVFAMGVWLAVRASRRALTEADRRRVDQRLGWALLAAWVVVNLYWLAPANFDASRSFPLHICDLAALAAPIALLAGARWAASIVYFWGLGLSTQGFITPVVREGPAHPEFWAFWINHGAVVGAGLYEVLARRYRPRHRDLLLACASAIGYAVVVIPFNMATGFNYGYIGAPLPETRTVLDALGPWPARLAPLTAIVMGVFVLLWLPWAMARHRTKPAPAPAPDHTTP